jgi:putative iron-regulated protein
MRLTSCKWAFLAILLCVSTSAVSLVAAQDDLETLKRAAIATYADVVLAGYEDSLSLALELQAAVEAFVAAPSVETQQAAKEAWLAAREPYGQTEAFRFYGGPIDDAQGPEGLINAWPLDEVYVDYVEDAPDAGIINDVANYPTIDAELLDSLNQVGAEENVSVGFHAIEFLLWGQDLSADGAGERSYTDYTTAPNADRRGDYLLATSQLLVQHLQYLIDAWAVDNPDNYRESFLALDTGEAISHMFVGIGVLSKSELAGERMFTAYDNQDQEDEHSCFSDNTHRDIFNNLQGIRNVYLGSYERLDGTVVEGTSLADVMEQADPEANARTLELLDVAQEQVNNIHVPFDQAITQGEYRPQVLDTVLALFDLGDQFAEDAHLLGLVINTALPA